MIYTRALNRLWPALVLTTVAFPAAAEDWRPVDPAQLALKEPAIEKDADAEALFWDVRVDDDLTLNYLRAVRKHYVRVKIFTARGKEAHGKVDIVFNRNVQVDSVAGRTIRPDGQVVELQKEDVHERTIVKCGGVRVSAMSFALPAVEPGAIVEYRWKEMYMDQLTSSVVLPLQREIPVWSVTYHLKPLVLAEFPFPMRSQTFNVASQLWRKEENGFYSATYEKLPAFKEEPHMPPENEVRAWMLVYYSDPKEMTPETYWKEQGREIFKGFKDSLKPNSVLTAAAQEAVKDAATTEEKAARLVQLCRTRVKNTSDDAAHVSDEETKRSEKNRTPKDTLERGVGDGGQIDILFAALANAAGLDARIAFISDRSRCFFDVNFLQNYFMRGYVVAVRDGDIWRMYEPSSRYAAPGMLRWQNEGVPALVSDPKEPFFVTTPVSPAEKSVSRRRATLKLAADGTLEGDVRLQYSGHAGSLRKELHDGRTKEAREEAVKGMAKDRLDNAEVTQIELEDVTDPETPIVLRYHIRVPGYASRTGKRLFVQPAFFQKGMEPRFPAQERRHAVYFDYSWAEDDEVRIELPAGYALDHPESPAAIDVAPIATYAVTMQVENAANILVYRRKLQFGTPKVLIFEPKRYTAVKTFFDGVHKGDSHTMALVATAAAVPAAK